MNTGKAQLSEVGMGGKMTFTCPPPSSAFLTELVARTRRYQGRGNYDDVVKFCEDLHASVGKEVPEPLTPLTD